MARVGAVPFWGLLGAVMAILLLAGPARAQQSPAQAGADLPVRTVRQIEALLAAKAQRTPPQRKVSSQLLEAQRTPAQLTVNSQLLDARRTPLREPTAAGTSRLRATDPDVTNEREATDGDARNDRVTVDIRADVTPALLARIRTLGGTVINSVPKFRAIRAQLPLSSVSRLAALAAVQSIRPADEAVTRKDNTSEGDVAHRAKPARTTHKVDGTGIGIGVISDGVRSLADRQATGDLPARVTVLPGQAGRGDEGTALLEIVHDLAPGAELYFATGSGGQAQMAANIESLCEAGANVIVDDIGYTNEAAFQDDIVAQGVNAAVAGGCVFFTAGGNDGNLTDGTTGVWEGDYAAGTSLIVDGETLGVRHDFGGGVEANAVSGSAFRGVSAIVLQWADPLGASANDYDLFLVNEDGDVIASSTDTQDGTQDPIEAILSPIFDFSGFSVVVVKAAGSDRYLRVHAFGGRLAIQTAGNLYGHSAAENAISVAMVDVRTAAGSGNVFKGTESVRTTNSDGPRRIFFQPDGTAITAGNFSSTGGKLLQKPDLTAATCVTTATPGFSTFCGTSAAAPHAAAIGALMLEAAGGPDRVTLAQLRTGVTTGTAVLDIETAGVDRDSGAGIVMAPGAVDAVDVAVADRNGAPTVENAVSDRTFAPGAAAVNIDLDDVFDDPDGHTLTYEAVSSDPDRLTITRSNAQVTITPGSPGRFVVRLRAIDPDGLSATDSFSVTVTAGSRDYDADNDGLIDVANLAQLDALRYDLDGDGLVDGATWMPYYTAYPMGALGMGCPSDGCTGYELTANLGFDTDDDGDVDSNDDYWKDGAGWEPIGEIDAPFTADFKGNRRTISKLFIHRDTEDEVGLFGAIDRSRIRGVNLVGADVTGRDAVGSLLGDGVYGSVVDNHATGQVSGQDEVGGLVGRTWGTVWYSSSAVNVSGDDAVGGLVGHQILNDTVAAYATGNVEGINAVGGLVGAVSDVSHIIEASYATGNVSGSGSRLTESDSGFIISDLLGVITPSGPSETTTRTGGGVGGLVGSTCGWVQVSYATGSVSGTAAVGGLVGSGRFAKAQSSYWDLETSGVRVGVGEDDENDNGVIDGTERLRLGAGGKTTAELQTPEDYTDIYEGWNVDLGDSPFGDGEPDDPWDFGTTAQYPVLSLDLNDDNRATWQEFGYQVRESLTLSATTTASQAQVALTWNAISTSSWSPAPDVSYTLYRDDGATIEAIETDLTGITHTDTGVTIGDTYTYWVAAVVDGGEVARSEPASVIAGGANQSPVSVGILLDRQLAVGSTAIEVDVAAAFQDPESDTLAFAASSSLTSVATLSRSGSVVTITPVAAGRTIIAVTATDAGGSNTSASQRFIVTVGNDYDADGDGLIGVSNLAQLDAMRYDLDGNGYAGTVAAYATAFPSPLDRMGCGVDGCSGYVLLADLDFDTDGDGAVDSDDDYWNDGDGWVPIGWDSIYEFPRFFNTTFNGNGHTLSNLFTAGRGYSGLFSAIGLDGVVGNLTLSDVNVTGTEAAGALVGENQGLLSGIQSSGQVFGELHVGGLVGLNLRLVYLSHSSAAVTGMRPPRPPGIGFVVTSGPVAATGGLVGYNTGFVVLSYATGPVTSDSPAGGLVGYHEFKLIAASYAMGPVSGSHAGGLVGTIGPPFGEEATIRASYATGSVDGGTAGGLVGQLSNGGIITASYATGRVPSGRNRGGLVGRRNQSGTVTNSYWDTRTSGHTSGSPGSGRTTSQLQSPTSYSGIYGSWNVDIDEDNMNDNPWDFGTSSEYPALRADMNRDDDPTWEEFGYQLRSGPTLTATQTTNAGQSQVELEWTAVALSSEWTPAPSVSYTVTREDDETIETIAENLTVLEYTDTDVAGETYIYQVVVVVDGGEAVRSATVSVTAAGNKRPVAVGSLRWRTLLVEDSAMTEVGGAFEDPEGDTITYAVSSSDTTVARVSISGTLVTITPVAEGRATITVTATDDGSNLSRTQQFTVTVLPTTAVDYDTDDDGLIEISNLAQLNAVRYDLLGWGWSFGQPAEYAEAFPNGGGVLACGGLVGCVGYELNADLDFDTDASGEADAGDTYWNNGDGWVPIGDSTSGFSAIFGGNGRTITNLFIDSSENDIGLFGVTRSSAVIRNLEMVSVQVTGTDNVGGLAGSNGGTVSGCYATGKVSGDDDVGGLIGANLSDAIVLASYSTVQVTGDDRIGGLAGSNGGEVTAAYATGRVVGDSESGGLIGGNTGDVNISYATGLVSGRSTVGGLVGRNSGGGTITDSYWDSDTSGRTTGSYGQAKNTAELQLPTSASDIYLNWNVDLDGDSMNDDPWDFGTAAQYPVLAVDTNGVGGATWKEFGQQLREGPILEASPGQVQVDLTWMAVTAGHWTPAPSVTYTLIRDDGDTLETLGEGLSGLTFTDTNVTAGVTYTYQVAAVVQGGEPTRSALATAATLPNMWLTPTAGDPVASVRSAATYTVAFQGAWTTTVTSGGVPSGAHFTTLIGGVHNAGVTFLMEGGMATAGVESMAELGGTSTLANEVRAADPNALSVLEGSDGNIGPTGSSTINTVTLTTDHPRVTLLSMVAPSPDWFVGVSGLSLFDAQGDWLPSRTVNLYPWDAGTEEGTEFSLSNSATSPQGTITSLRGMGKFSNERIATLTFTRQSVNTAPSFTSNTRFEADENQTATGRVVAADPDSGDGVTYAITGGADASKFDIGEATGVLTFQVPPNHERAPDAASTDPPNGAGNNEYIVTVTATGGTGDRAMTAAQTITVTVRNLDEAGTISFSRGGTAITAVLSDPDGGVNGATWQWARSSNRSTGWANIGSATSASYTPSSADQGMYLRALVSYNDAHGSGKQAQGVSASQIAPPDLRVATFVSGLSIPWDIAFTPDGTMLFTQRAGVLSSRLADGTVQAIDADFGDLYANGETGLMGIDADPDFTSNRRFYTCQGHTGPEVQVIAWSINAAYTQATRIADPLIGGIPATSGRHGGCRLRFGPEGYLWIATGDAASGTVPQDLTSLGGKVLRVDASTGAGAPTNPFAPSRVYTYGHRNVQGLALRPGTRQMWSVEHGPSVDDEINLLVAGRNYGWNPVPGYNEGVPMTGLVEFPEAVEAKWSSGSPTLATSGGVFLEGDPWGVWEGRLAVATLKDSKLRLFEFTPDGALVSQVVVAELNGAFGRLRTPMIGPDGALYVSTSNGGGSDRILRIAEDDPIPVTLKLTPATIGENGGVSTVTASQNRVSIAATTVTVSAMAVNPAVPGDFMLSANRTLTIPAGQLKSTGTVTVRAVDNTVDAPNTTVTVSGAADNIEGVAGPAAVTLTIVDDDAAPEVTLKLTPSSISENGGVSTVTATLNRASIVVTAVSVSTTAVRPAVPEDFTVSANRTLTIPAGQTESTGTVTVRAVDNTVDAPNKEVQVSATADNSHGIAGNPPEVRLRITDDDTAPELTLAVRPSPIAEAGGSATVTVEIVNGVTFAEDQQIALTFAGTATKGTDYTVGLERLPLTAGQSSTTTTVTTVDDALDDEAETIRVTARHGGGILGAEQTITIIDDDASPVITTAFPILVAENETVVVALTATDADRPPEDLTWRITGGADRNRFTLAADGELTFRVAQDYEAPADSDRDRDYEVTVQVSDGFNLVEAVFTVRLQDVDDTAPVLSSASVDGAALTLAYGEVLDGSSNPAASDFTVSGGDSARTVSNVAVSGRAVTLTLNPAVEHGETGIRVSYRLGANPIRDAAENAADGLSNAPVTNNTGDTTAPTVNRIEITSRPGPDATYAAEEEIEVTVTFSETVVVTGPPRLMLKVGGVDRPAAYRSVTGAAVLFAYPVADGESDTDGVRIEADSLSRNGGRIRDGADNDALLTHDAVAADSGHTVDGAKPALAANGGAVVNGATLALTYSETLDGGSTPLTAAFTVNVEGTERSVSRVAVSGSAVTLTLESEVGVGQGVRITYRVPGANPIQDAVGNPAGAITDRAVENNTRDTAAPTVSRVAIRSNPGPDGIYAEADVIEVTVIFNETVRVDTTHGTPSLTLRVGRRSKPAHYIQGPASATLTFTYTVEGDDIDIDGVSLAAGRIALNGGTINDGANNPAVLAHEAVPPQPGHAVDGVRPEIQRAAVDGATLTLTYGEALDGNSTPATDDFTVTVAATERLLTQVLVSGRVVQLTLDLPVTPGETVKVSYTAGTDPIQDAAGNAAEDLTEHTAATPPPGGGGSGGGGSGGGGGGGGGGSGGGGGPTVNTDPVITTPGPFAVEENQTRVVRLQAVDKDPGDAIRSYAIAGGADGDRFAIVAHTGVLSFREPPNFEAPADVGSTDPPSEAGDNEYIVVVRVASGPVSRDRTVEQAFAVRVTDDNTESPGAPGAPRLTLALEASLTVEWSEPDNSGPPITDYDVQYREGPSGFFINAPHEGTGRTATLTGLKAATLYQVQVRASNEEGTGRWSPPGEGLTLAGPTAVLPFSVPDRGGFSVTSQGTSPELRIGYGQVETDPGMTPPVGLAIFGSRPNGILVSEAGVPASAPVLEGRIFAETAGAVRTGVALANPNDRAATIPFFFTNSEGIDFGHGTFTLEPREQKARFLDEAPFNGGSAIEGTFTFTSDLPVAVIALRGVVNERSEFLMTTLPVAPLTVPTTDTVYFPHFAAGGGWTTQVILVNPTHAPIGGSVQFFGSGSETEAAASATLTLADGRSGSIFSYSIPPRSATRLRTSSPAGALQVGSVRAVPGRGQSAPSGVSIFSFQKDGMTVSEAGVPASTSGAAFRVYVEASGAPGQPHSVRSGIALTNTSGAPTTVSLELTNLDGTATGSTEPLTIPASGHVARFIDEFFPGLPTPFSGILRIASTAPDIAAVGLRLAINPRGDILVTTTPPVDETAAPTASGLFFPHFVDSGGWTTQFILFSGSPGQTASGVIRFTGQDGQPLELSVAPTAAPTIP